MEAGPGQRSSNNVNEAVLPGTANGGGNTNANEINELQLDEEHNVQKNASMT